MKYALKIYAGFFLFVALVYIVLGFVALGSEHTSKSGSTITICIMVALTVMEIDRRLAKIENTTKQDDVSTDGDVHH